MDADAVSAIERDLHDLLQFLLDDDAYKRVGVISAAIGFYWLKYRRLRNPEKFRRFSDVRKRD